MSLSSPPRRVNRRFWVRPALAAVEAFVAIGAVYGSIMLISDAWRLDHAMLRHLPVDSWVLPGVALAVLIAVPNLFAGILVTINHPVARTVSLLAGGVLVGWIIGQLALIQQYFFLQPVMGISGPLTLGLAALLPGNQIVMTTPNRHALRLALSCGSAGPFRDGRTCQGRCGRESRANDSTIADQALADRVGWTRETVTQWRQREHLACHHDSIGELQLVP
jgi:hypothetical protein